MLHLLAQSSSDAAAGAMAGGFLIFEFLFAVVAYVVFAMALMTLAKKMGKEDKSVWAWIPILNLILLAELADQEMWMGLLCIICGFITIFLFWKIAEKRGKPGPIALLLLVPCVGFFVPLYLAYSE